MRTFIEKEHYMKNGNDKKLWIFSELFYPEETSTSLILLKIANKLSEKYSVNVISGNPVYKTSNCKNAVAVPNKNINIQKIYCKHSNNISIVDRTKRAIILSYLMAKYLLHNVSSKDTVIAITNPPILIIFVSILKKITNFRYCILVHDVFPENCIPAKIFNSKRNVLYKILKYIYTQTYKQADIIITCGNDIKSYIEKKIKNKSKIKIECITNWADLERVYPIQKVVENKKVILKFAGNLGRVQGLLNLLEIIKQTNNPDLLFIFQGSGAMKLKMEQIVKDEDILNVKFLGPYSRKEEHNVLNDCDIGIVSLDDKMVGFGVPSKTYNIMAAGKPVLFLGSKQSEIAKLIQEYKIGYSFSFSQKAEIISFLNSINMENKDDLKRIGNLSRSVAEAQFSEKVILQKYMEIL